MIRRIFWYVEHLVMAGNVRSISHPIVSQLISDIVPHQPSLMGLRFEQLRQNLRRAQQQVCFEDLGAGFGGKVSKRNCKSLGYLVRRSARRRPEGELLYRLAKYQQPRRCLELGTHLGFSGLYQMAGLSENIRFITLEGAKEVAELAETHFRHFGFYPEQHIGEFAEVLPQLNLSAYQPDWVLLDGNHRYEPTMAYARMILPHMPAGSIMILDDIYWSKGMRQAWLELLQEPQISLSVDLFHLGLLFIGDNRGKEHFRIPPFYTIFTA